MIVNANWKVHNAIQVKNRRTKHVNLGVKIIVRAKKCYSWNPRKCICENSKYLKSIFDNSKIVCDGIIYVMGIAATNVSTNSDDKKGRY